ncbi:MAG: ATP-binding protein [Candidatus Andersenbacteria bacterium]
MKDRKNSKSSSDSVSTGSQQINRELYKRNAELAVRNKTLALLRKLDEISLRAIGIQPTAQEIAGAISVEFGYEIVSVAIAMPEKKELRWLALASSVPTYSALFGQVIPGESDFLAKAPAKKLEGQLRKDTFVKGIDSLFPDDLKQKIGAIKGDAISSTLVYPLVFEEKPIGIITFSAIRNLHELTKYEHESIEGIVSLTSLALYKAKLFEDLQTTTEQLREANHRLKELMEIKTQFLHIASHQLRTPLTSLRGFLDMQASGDFDKLTPDRRKELQKTMAMAGDQLNALVNDLLNAMELEGGAPNIKPIATDVWKVIEEAVVTLQIAFDKKGLKLVANKPAIKLPQILADASYLRQVFLNSLDNAMKYTPKGSVTISAKVAGKNIAIDVTDTGIGIDPRDKPKLFGKFVRGGNSETQHTTGSGLGLFIMKQIVQQHHGTIELRSDGVGKGTTVHIELPILKV